MMYLVIGTTGEYSDRSEWPVAVYWEQGKAAEHAARAKARVAEIVASPEWKAGRYCRGPKPENVWDPNWEHDYTGTDYTVAEVPLFEAVP